MTLFLVETYVIKPEKQAEFMAYKEKWKQFFAYKENRPQLFEEVKSYRMFAQMFGGNVGGYVETWEFDNLAKCDEFFHKVMQSDYPTKLYPEFASLLVPATYTMNVWNSIT